MISAQLLKKNISEERILLVGAGGMAEDYAKVLSGLKKQFSIVGRSAISAQRCQKNTGVPVWIGGLNSFLVQNREDFSHAIIAVGVEALYDTAQELLDYGIKNILIEKPGALLNEQFEALLKKADKENAEVYIAYNRRFYASVLEAKKMIEEDGGVTSFNFEFTEWSHVIAPLEKGTGVKEKWFLGNSTHVVDLAFYLGGKPKNITSYVKGSLSWHPSGSIFCGAGESETGALFSYQANWESAGRWSVEMLTMNHRLILRPMEKLQIQKRGTINQEIVETIDDTLDDMYKPGLYRQTEHFLNGTCDALCSLKEQTEQLNIYNKIANY
ncbi:MAG: Gfo/Idh/MocA family oxidoreductase [Campylobacterales bacterium]|nr:Gfo/Idh/MocA family oxidoreductase [Campylobacterales bacterium]MBN2832935.1 Gfo/Idh/MocA family oxidoreductase [Campylobacterales bacterium]